MEKSKFFKIGYLAKMHGLKGEMTMVMGIECPDLRSIRHVFLQLNHQFVPHFIESVSFKGSKAFIKLEDISTPDQAALLKGASVFIPKKDRPRLDKGNFYMDEVISFEVYDHDQGLLGRVKEVLQAGPARHLVVDRQPNEVLIPLNGPFIKRVDKSRKKIEVELPQGFLDL